MKTASDLIRGLAQAAIVLAFGHFLWTDGHPAWAIVMGCLALIALNSGGAA